MECVGVHLMSSHLAMAADCNPLPCPLRGLVDQDCWIERVAQWARNCRFLGCHAREQRLSRACQGVGQLLGHRSFCDRLSAEVNLTKCACRGTQTPNTFLDCFGRSLLQLLSRALL